MRRMFHTVLTVLASAGIWSCMDYGPQPEESFSETGKGVFIVNEGNFNFGNASLSYYDVGSGRVENSVFSRANGMSLGDVAQSMTVHGGRGYIAVNNSGVVFVIDLTTFRLVGTLEGLTSPRYVHFASDTKAYVTDLYDTRITIFDPTTMQVTGHVETGRESTEQMVQYGRYLFVNCWSYDNRILVIDTETDEVCDEITVGIQPTSLVLDRNGKVWTITDGGYEGSPYGYEAPALYRIDAETRKVECEFLFALGDAPSEICIDGDGGTLYFINGGVWRMDVGADRLPDEPLIPDGGTLFYGLGVDPETSEIYVADAVDYMQSGVVMRYSADGEPLGNFRVGITPGDFCFVR